MSMSDDQLAILGCLATLVASFGILSLSHFLGTFLRGVDLSEETTVAIKIRSHNPQSKPKSKAA